MLAVLPGMLAEQIVDIISIINKYCFHQQSSNDVGLLTSSGESSDSSESDSGSASDSDDDDNDKSPVKPIINRPTNHHHMNGGGSLPALLLDEDLRLSESGDSE